MENLKTLVSIEGEILLRLKKSRIRREVLSLLVRSYPEPMSASQMAVNLHCNIGDVGGVLHGSKPRYREEDSLASLGLVEAVLRMSGYMTNVKFYRATPKAKPYYNLLWEGMK